MSQTHNATLPHSQTESRQAALPAIIIALLLGSFLIFGTGFAPFVHDQAHDTRHSFSFPCH